MRKEFDFRDYKKKKLKNSKADRRKHKRRKHKRPFLPISIGDVRLKELRKMSYSNYLLTFEWGLIRKIVLEIKPVCEICKVKKVGKFIIIIILPEVEKNCKI